jgi:hypothetical protein
MAVEANTAAAAYMPYAAAWSQTGVSNHVVPTNMHWSAGMADIVVVLAMVSGNIWPS